MLAFPLHMASATETAKGDLETKVYEVSFLTPAKGGEEGALATLERVKTAVSSMEGTFIAEGTPKQMPFASEVSRSASGKRERHNEGFFGWVKFEFTPDNAPALEVFLKKDVDILRFILISTVRDSGPAPRFLSSDRLEGETIRKREVVEKGSAGPVSEEELDKSIEQLVGDKA